MSFDDDRQSDPSGFAHEAESGAGGFLSEFWYFVRYNKKWWLTPIIVVLLLVSVLILIGGTGAAPFIYSLF